MAPDLQRLGEPVDVLRAAELPDPRLVGSRQIALHVLGRERAALRRCVVLVRPQVEVVVGEHGRCTLAGAWSTGGSWSRDEPNGG
jgi:hypothetical protein